MATCNDCIHRTVCVILAMPDAFENTKWDKEPCDHFKAADVAPRVEVAREIMQEIDEITNGDFGDFIRLPAVPFRKLKAKYTNTRNFQKTLMTLKTFQNTLSIHGVRKGCAK